MRIPLIGSSYSAFSVAAAAQQSMNCYLESIEAAGEKSKQVLRGIPGIQLFKDLTVINGSATPNRGLFSGGGRLFVVAGTKHFEVDSTGALVGSVRTVADDAGHSPAQMFPNGNQIFIVSAGTAYCDNGAGPVAITLPTLSGTATSIPIGGIFYLSWEPTASGATGNTDRFDVGMTGQAITYNGAPFTIDTVISDILLTLTTNPGIHSAKDWSSTPALNPSTGCFIDGYFIVNRKTGTKGTRQFNISPLNNGMGDAGDGVWNAIDYDIKSGYPDWILAVWAEAPLLYLLGTETMEIWRDTGNADFPFQRVDGGFARIGLAATWSPASIAGKLHMLAGGTYGQTVAVRMDGITPVRISTHAVEEAWAAAGTLAAKGVSYSYVDRGHWFWVINFAGTTYSWVYDATESGITGTPQWHQRARYTAGAFAPYRPWYHTFIPEWGANGKHIVGDYVTGNLYEMSSDFFDDNGTDIRIQRAMSHIYTAPNKRTFISRVDIEHEAGMSWNAGANTPTMTLDWSYDRGHTFTGGPRTLSTGASGAYSARAYANQLGQAFDRVFRLTVSGQSKVAIIDATAEVEVGQ